MDVLIVSQTDETHGNYRYRYATGVCGTVKVTVGFVTGPRVYVAVCVLNASHRVWRGLGREFSSIADALGAYKSSEVKSIIEAARDAFPEPTEAPDR